MSRAPKVCGTPGCPLDQPCPTHTRKPWARTERRAEFTKTQRARILRRDHLCAAGCGRPSTEADHVTPIAWGGANDITNGQGLCSTCHAEKSKAERLAGRRR